MENKYDYEYDKFREAGKASFEALTYAKELVKPGKKLIDTANELEKFMKGKGFGLAFPVNISINENAAHYTPTVNDESVFTNNDLVKIDLGARKDTYLQDCAVTIDLSGKYANFVDTAQKALQEAISSVKAGRKVCEIGAAVEKVVKGAGLKPIENLGGHGISEEDLHADIFIPNYDNGDDTALEEGQVVAAAAAVATGEEAEG
jgi:methionyl aminopeptidase